MVGDLSLVRQYALSLPGTAEQPHFDMTSFRVRGKIFATATADETRLHVFVDESEVAATVAELAGSQEPLAFEPLLWGERVRGLRITLAAASDDRVRELLAEAWRRKAGRRLVSDWDMSAPGSGPA